MEALAPVRRMPSVAVIGLGPMGAPIAGNLVRSGFATIVWNRTRAKAEDVVRGGAVLAARPRDVLADVTLSVLPDVDQLLDLLDRPDGLEHGLRASGGRLVVLSTTSPANIHALAERLEPLGVGVVDAPMSGGDAGARNRSLVFMVGGSPTDVAAVAPVLDALGTVHHMGPSGAGATTKLCNQLVVAGVLSATADALAAAEASGLDPATVLDVFAAGLAHSAVLDLKRPHLLTGDFAVGGSTRNQLKDLRYADSTLTPVHRSPLLPVLLQLFEDAEASGLGDLDHTAVLEVIRRWSPTSQESPST